jgi:hypothetical protein
MNRGVDRGADEFRDKAARWEMHADANRIAVAGACVSDSEAAAKENGG